MQYKRLCSALNDPGLLVPAEELNDHIKDYDSDWYRSVYNYNKDHLATFKETDTVAGIIDVEGNTLPFDFDSEKDPELARADALELASRLLAQGITEDQMNITFSGHKGYGVELALTKSFKPAEIKNMAKNLAGDLQTFDNKIYNASRILRIPYTKHQTTGLYKIPIKLSTLSDHSTDAIKEIATSLERAEDWNNSLIEPKSEWLKQAEISTPRKAPMDLGDLDMSLKPKWMPACRYAIMNGFFEGGNRSNALTSLAAILKANGIPKRVCHNMLKGAAAMQADRTHTEVFAKEEIWNNIVSVVYGDNWQGKTFGCKDHEFLQEVCPVIGTSKCSATKHENVVRIEDVSGIFENYAVNIDKNTVKTGIASIDTNLRLQTCSHVVIAAAAGTGKCLGKGTLVRMFKGPSKKVEDIKVGDLLMGDDSTPRKVLSTCKGREVMYKVEQTRGDSYVVNASHILSLKYSQKKVGPKDEVFDMNIEDFISKCSASSTFKKGTSGYRVAVEYPEKDLKLSPYVLGYWLGNGTSAKPAFTIHEAHLSVIDKLDLELLGDERVFIATSGASKTWSYRNNKILLPSLKKYNLLNNKHIPDDYLYSSTSQRLELLAGLLDSDGHLDKRNKTSYEYTTKHEHLAQQIKYLCLSLGYFATYSAEIKRIKALDFEGTYYRLYINGNTLNEIPVQVTYKKANRSKQQGAFTNSNLTITKLPEDTYYGFEIDGNHRFLLHDFTVTHNTTLVLNILSELSNAGSASLFCSMDMGAPLIYQKLAQKVTGYTDKKLYQIYKDRNKEETARIKAAISDGFKNVRFDFRQGIDIDQLRDNILETKHKVGTNLKLVVLDFINRIRGPYGDETANLSYIAPRLADLANETETLILSLAQIARSKGGPSTPITDSRVAKGSSAIEESATALLGMWRPGYNKGDDDKYISIAAVKTRMGKEFTEHLHFDGLTSTIRDLTRDEQLQYEEFIDRMEEEKEVKKKGTYEGW